MLKCKLCSAELVECIIDSNLVFYICDKCSPTYKYCIKIDDSRISAESFRTNNYCIQYIIEGGKIIETRIGTEISELRSGKNIQVMVPQFKMNGFLNFDFSNEELVDKKIKTLILFQ